MGFNIVIWTNVFCIISTNHQKVNDMTHKELKLRHLVYHQQIYNGKEPMKIVGVRETEVELEGDYSGGTHNVRQSSWMPIKGIIKPNTYTKK